MTAAAPAELAAVSPAAKPSRRQIWSLGGGKGGIGKSLLAASLGYQLARTGRRVVLVDADLGGSNLHTCLGLEMPALTLGDFLQRRVERIEDVLVETGVPGLRLVSGASDFLAAANIKHVQKVRILNKLRGLDVDVVLLDLGAGSSFNIIDFFLISDVSRCGRRSRSRPRSRTATASSSALYRRLRRGRQRGRPPARRLRPSTPRAKASIRTPLDLLQCRRATRTRKRTCGRRSRRSTRASSSTRCATERPARGPPARRRRLRPAHLGVRSSYVGFVPYEDAVWRAVHRRQLFMTDAAEVSRGRPSGA